MTNARGSAAVVVLVLLAGILLAIGNVLVFAAAAGVDVMASPLDQMRQIYERQPVQFLYFVATPLLFALFAALLASMRSGDEVAPVAAAPAEAEPAPPSPDPALRLLARFQQEGRLIDFLEEDIEPYSDAQVGAAARTVHAGCRKVLQEHVRIERVHSADDGAEVDIPAGFDPARIRLIGNVHGEPPFHGVLQHGGYRAVEFKAPAAPADPTILAPAEVEIV